MPSCMNHAEVMSGLNACTRCGKTFCGDCLVELKSGFFCAGCKSEQVKDIQSGVPTGGEMRFAGFWVRLCAWIVDAICLWVVSIPLSMVMMSAGAAPRIGPSGAMELPPMYWVTQLILLVVNISYQALMLQFKGQTVGKMALKLKVVTPEGNAISPGQAWFRAVMQIVAAIPLLATYWVLIFTKDKTALHDLAAKTRVIRLNQ